VTAVIGVPPPDACTVLALAKPPIKHILKVAYGQVGGDVKALVAALLLAVAVIGATSASVDAATGERRVALLVGNSRYTDAPLKNPANDARAMSATLRERGFDVILRVDATKQQMESAIIEFGEKLTEGATGLFFFAGHGMQVQGRNYIIPTDAKLTSEQRIKLETIDIDAVLDQMQGARSKVNVVILDACRNNPFERRFRSASGGLAQINAPEGTLIAYATAPGRVAADGEGDNGLYTNELLKALRTPGLKVEDVFKQVRINVARASNGAQTPWEASSLVGDFYFIPPAPVAAAIAPSNAAELEFWNSIRTANSAAEYKAYLNQYPRGQFVTLAQTRIAALEKAQADAADTSRIEMEKIRLEASERSRLEIERIRREAAERSRQEVEKARADAAENARQEIERARMAATAASTAVGAAKPVTVLDTAKPVQQAALPSPGAPVTAPRYDGIYNAKFTLIATNGFINYDAAIEINGAQILGKAAATGAAPDPCTVSGSLDTVSGEIASMFMQCRWTNAHFKGRFVLNPQTNSFEGKTEARSVNDGRVVPIVWAGPKMASSPTRQVD
jgi:uncharacterized caspase-like protein